MGLKPKESGIRAEPKVPARREKPTRTAAAPSLPLVKDRRPGDAQIDEQLDAALEATFPASDPIAITIDR
jgi:hypothetical protein